MVFAQILGPDGLIVVIVVVVVLLFGGAKLPKLARGLGSASHEFKKGITEGQSDQDGKDAAPDGAVAPPRSENASDGHP